MGAIAGGALGGAGAAACFLLFALFTAWTCSADLAPVTGTPGTKTVGSAALDVGSIGGTAVRVGAIRGAAVPMGPGTAGLVLAAAGVGGTFPWVGVEAGGWVAWRTTVGVAWPDGGPPAVAVDGGWGAPGATINDSS